MQARNYSCVNIVPSARGATTRDSHNPYSGGPTSVRQVSFITAETLNVVQRERVEDHHKSYLFEHLIFVPDTALHLFRLVETLPPRSVRSCNLDAVRQPLQRVVRLDYLTKTRHFRVTQVVEYIGMEPNL